MTKTIAEFLLARIAEDEFDGRYATTWELCNAAASGDIDSKASALSARGRVLAECEAKRRVVEAHRLRITMAATPVRRTLRTAFYEGGHPDCSCGHNPCPTLNALAAIYRDHPDYRQEWKP